MKHREKGVLKNSVMCFYTPTTTALEYLFYYNYTGLFYCDSQYRISRGLNEFHEPYLLAFVNKGVLHLEYQDKHFTAQENQCLFFDCRQPHCYYAENNTAFQFVHFGGNISEYYYQRMCLNQQNSFQPTNPQALSACLSSILEKAEEKIPNEHVISSYIHRLMGLLLSSTEAFSSLNAKRVASAVRFMEENIADAITLSDIAAHLVLNPYYFSRIFHQYTGSGPYNYLLNLRISHGKMLLMTTYDSVTAISEKCGFNSAVHFINIFKQKVGMTPLQFRKFH
ncbi:MAG: AraC family transcriptional regulator [Lachnospiraceae bacterium]